MLFKGSTSTGTIISASWDFGDGSSSALLNPSYSYPSAGNYVVKGTFTIGTTTCIDTYTIAVFPLPEPAVTLMPGANYCLSQNKVCFEDKTKPGGSLSLTKRYIVWGDGGFDSITNPVSGNIICRKYASVNNFQTVFEWKNSKGCIKKLIVPVTILQDGDPILSSGGGLGYCDSVVHCFNLNNVTLAKVQNITWFWGDGKTEVKNTLGICHAFKNNSKNNSVIVAVRLPNGCVNYDTIFVDTRLPKANKINDNGKSKCIRTTFKFWHDSLNPLYTVNWSILDSFGKEIEASFSKGYTAEIKSWELGKFIIKFSINAKDCKINLFDTIEVVGVQARGLALNRMQCGNRDSVLFCDYSKTYKSTGYYHIWDYGDYLAPKCTTNTLKNQNINKGCNYNEDPFSRHKYSKPDCYRAVFTVRDNTFNCVDTNQQLIALEKQPIPSDFRYITTGLCSGNINPGTFRFFDSTCHKKIKINTDSMSFPHKWQSNIINNSNYPTIYVTTGDTNGYVTVGFSLIRGNPKFYRSCDTSDYLIDSSRMCFDTIWKHHWYKLEKPPKPGFSYKASGCRPLTVDLLMNDSFRNDYKSLKINWGDGSAIDTFYYNKNEPFRFKRHVYTIRKTITIFLILTSPNGCQSISSKQFDVGFSAVINANYPEKCNYNKMLIYGGARYFNDTNNYWNRFNRPEKFLWNFGDDTSYTISKNFPVLSSEHIYLKPGPYTITAKVSDSLNCTDTFTKNITIHFLEQSIGQTQDTLLCDDYVEFWHKLKTSDSTLKILEFNWEFGDGKADSKLPRPVHYYNSKGLFTVKLTVKYVTGYRLGNPMIYLDTCYDYFYTKIFVRGPKPYFDILSDTVGCSPFVAKFKSYSVGCREFTWYFNDQNKTTFSNKNDTTLHFNYPLPGTYPIFLAGIDSILNPVTSQYRYCRTVFPDTTLPSYPRRVIVVLPHPKSDFNLPDSWCAGKPVLITNNSDPILTQFDWDLGDSTKLTTNISSFSHTYKDTGTYIVNVNASYPPTAPYFKTCPDTTQKSIKIIQLSPSMKVRQTGICPEFLFEVTCPGASSFYWDFGHPKSGKNNNSTNKLVSHSYKGDTGSFKACVTSSNTVGCDTTICTTINVTQWIGLMIPNTFTPNTDGFNDQYKFIVEKGAQFQFDIFDIWGMKVYTATHATPNLGWNGKMFNSGTPCTEGTYYFVLRVKHLCSDKWEKIGGPIMMVK